MKTAVRTITALDLLFRYFYYLTLLVRQLVPLIGTHLGCQIVLFHTIDLVKFTILIKIGCKDTKKFAYMQKKSYLCTLF